MHGKDKCSVCGNYTDIVAKVTSDPNIFHVNILDNGPRTK